MYKTIALGLLAGLSHVIDASPTPRVKSISWGPCPKNITSTLQCADFQVPLDYTSDSDEKLTLNLAKLPATKRPSKGSIFLNTGGPGLPARNDLLGSLGKGFQLLTGQQYDIVTFDPRGTGETIPFSCYNTSAERIAAATGVPSTWTESNTATGYLWAVKQMMAEKCALAASNVGELLGTAFVARDIMQVVDALGEDGMVRFLGYSYGTILGATLAAMFPDRIDKMTLDGVVNADDYYAGVEISEVVRSDEVWAGFFKGCMEAPTALCPLQKYADSADDLQKKIEDLIEEIKFNPIPLGPIMPTDLVDYSTLRQAIFVGLYGPGTWPTLATVFDAILTPNATSYSTNVLVLLGAFSSTEGFPSVSGPEALQGIRCGETALRTNNVEDIIPILHEFQKTSYISGDMESTPIFMSCAAWQMKAKEVYSGGFQNIKTKSPLLFVGSPFDPLTPLPSAKNVSAAFKGSGLVQHDGYGHGSIAQPSLCTAKAVRAYFTDGTLPEEGTVCQPDVPIFPPPGESFTDVLQPLNGTSKRSVEASEDVKLLEALSLAGRSLSNKRRLV